MSENTEKRDAAEELELTDAQADRNDDIYEAAFEFCKVLTEQGHKVRFPSVVTEQDGTQYIEEYYGG